MSKGLIEKNILIDIADAIREKTESTDLIKPSQMASAVRGITGGGGGGGSSVPSFIRFDCTGVVGTFTVPKASSAWRTSTTSSPVIQKGCRFHALVKNNTTTACTYYVDITTNGEPWIRLLTKDSSAATEVIAIPLDDFVGHSVIVRLGVYNKHQYNDWTWTIDTMYIDNPDELVLFENGVYLNPDIFEGFNSLGINATTKAIYMSFNGTGGNSYLSKKSIDTTRYNTVHMLVDTTYSTGYSIPTWNFVLKYSDESGATSDYDSFNGAVVGRESVIPVKEKSRVNLEVGYSSKQQIITCSIYKIWLAYDPQIKFPDTSIMPSYFRTLKGNYVPNVGTNSLTSKIVSRNTQSYSSGAVSSYVSFKPYDLTNISKIKVRQTVSTVSTYSPKYFTVGIVKETTSIINKQDIRSYMLSSVLCDNGSRGEAAYYLDVSDYNGEYYICLCGGYGEFAIDCIELIQTE